MVTRAKKKKTPTKTFTIPESDLRLMDEIQSRCRKHDLSLNDSEVVRAGFAALFGLRDSQFLARVKAVIKLKPGRSKKAVD